MWVHRCQYRLHLVLAGEFQLSNARSPPATATFQRRHVSCRDPVVIWVIDLLD